MAIKRKDIRDILANEEMDSESKTKKLLDLIHDEIDTVRDERDQIQAELDKAKTDLTAANNAKEKAEKDYNDYKDAQSKKETRTAKETAYAKLLKDSGVAEKHHKLILKASDIDSIELDKDGNIKDSEALAKSIKAEYKDYIGDVRQKGASFDRPPDGHGGTKMTKEEIMAIKDTATRQAESLAWDILSFFPKR